LAVSIVLYVVEYIGHIGFDLADIHGVQNPAVSLRVRLPACGHRKRRRPLRCRPKRWQSVLQVWRLIVV
jgi:hypothetical protein